ncbi:MAG: PRTRC system protein C [Chloroflexi bacterium]|nr:PRTRC system protein C [Chloroflexota bacterium]
MPRIFVYDGRQFPDPDPVLSVEDVRKQLADFFPELANAETREERRGEDETRYTFTRRIGTKGRRRATVVEILRRVPEKRLAVFALAGELVGPDGELDVDAAAARQPEVNLATAEAESYSRATQQAVRALRELRPR